jgi:pyruvate dehydrogenase E1 component
VIARFEDFVTMTLTDQKRPAETICLLETIQQRVLWLATNMIHYANHIRPNPDVTKVGGHQASSASMVTILTALYFAYLQHDDRISIKPHASPVFHAIQYLLGQLPREYLTELRAYGGLQAYPSRTKDPDPVHFSTGSVGLGAVAPAFAALANQYIGAHFDRASNGQFIAVIGDAELDEGNIWEAIIDEPLAGLGNLLWIVDVNRQSLDQVIPGIKAARLKRLFAACGWQVLEAKYGTKLQAVFSQLGGDKLRNLIDQMSNEEYQNIIRQPPAAIRKALVGFHGAVDEELLTLLATVNDDEIPVLIQDLGGHDFHVLLQCFAQAREWQQSPTVIFAYTIKGWGLPIAGDPFNHSRLLTQAQMDEFRKAVGISSEDEWPLFAPESAEGRYIQEISRRLYRQQGQPAVDTSTIRHLLPDAISIPARGQASTQQTFGRVLIELAKHKEFSKYLVTASPDVAISTHLYDWVRTVGHFNPAPGSASDAQGQHIELGISEMNLFMLLAMFGLSAELIGQPLIPIGTVYDPFVCRGLDSFIYGVYSNSRFIVAGTPSGITLAPEGGAHQSTITPSIGAELPNLHYFEPCYAQELAWIVQFALEECLDRDHGRATYLRLSTRPVDQKPFHDVLERLGEELLRRYVLGGGYRLLDWRSASSTIYREYMVHIVVTGVMVPEAIEAAYLLHEEGIAANVLYLTSPRRIYETWRKNHVKTVASQSGARLPFDWLIPMNERYAPMITVNDGASHSLAWLGSVYGAPVIPLGVDEFGQSGDRDSLYEHFGISAQDIAAAAFTALDHM